MGFLIGLLTFIMVLDCLLLILLVLIQLPKKEAGAGLAFGGSATDALFGAGSGTVLTKITKYAAGTFFALAVVLSVMNSHYHTSALTKFRTGLGTAKPPPGALVPPAAPSPAATPVVSVPLNTNQLKPTTVEETNLLVIPSNALAIPTNAAAPSPPQPK